MKTAQEQKRRSTWRGLAKLVSFAGRYKGIFAAMVVMTLLCSGVDTLLPLFQKYAIDHFIGKGVLDTLLPFILLYVFMVVIKAAGNYYSTYFASYVEMYVGRDLKQMGFDHLQTLSFSYFNRNSVGYIHARIMSDTERIGSMCSWGMMDVVWEITYLIGAVAVMFSLNWKLALLVLVMLPVAAVAVMFFNGRLVRIQREIREINSHITGGFNEGITGAKTVKSLVAEEKLYKDFSGLTGKMKRMTVRATRYRSLLMAIILFATSMALALVLQQGGYITMEGVMEIGTLSTFMSYAITMMDPVQGLIEIFSEVITVQVNIERLTNLLETSSDVTDTPEVIERYGDSFCPKRENWEPLEGDIRFEDVTFRYPDGDVNVLEHFDLTVPKGACIAIVGETGAGKSTIVNLVCRFFEPTEGRVLIDGRDARERSQLWLHSSIGYVLQTPHLFSGTVLDNLRYGNPEATPEEIQEAVRLVSAQDVIAKLEKGFDTDIGEGGDMLSTGEKQLLSFARAILAKPKILILDEATSSIDTLTESRIQAAIGKVIEGRTSFIIAHRLSTIRNADEILVVRDGQIVERGDHRSLLRRRGYYYDLYMEQYQEDSLKQVFDGTSDI